jgi:TonB family protein
MFRSILMIVLLLTWGVAADASYWAGKKAYEKGDYEAALREWRPAADKGDPRAQYWLGVLYDEGQGLPKDTGEAAKWYRRAADQGIGDAQNRLGYFYDKGEGVDRDRVQAHAWYELAILHGSENSAPRLRKLGRKLSNVQRSQAARFVETWKEQRLREVTEGEPLLAGVGGVTIPRLIGSSKVAPAYPEPTRLKRIEGRVILQAVVRSNGTVDEIEILSCNRPELGFEEASIDAVSQWRYEPATYLGQAVDVYFTVRVDFELKKE